MPLSLWHFDRGQWEDLRRVWLYLLPFNLNFKLLYLLPLNLTFDWQTDFPIVGIKFQSNFKNRQNWSNPHDHHSGSTQYQTYFAVCLQHFSQLQRAMVTLAWHDQIHLMSWYSGKDWPEACLSISYYSPPTASPTLGTFMFWPSLNVWCLSL